MDQKVGDSNQSRTRSLRYSSSCPATTGGRGEPCDPAQDPRCPPRHYLHGTVRRAHRGPRAGGGYWRQVRLGRSRMRAVAIDRQELRAAGHAPQDL